MTSVMIGMRKRIHTNFQHYTIGGLTVGLVSQERGMKSSGRHSCNS